MEPTTIAPRGPTTISRQPSGRIRSGPTDPADPPGARDQKASTKEARAAGGGYSVTLILQSTSVPDPRCGGQWVVSAPSSPVMFASGLNTNVLPSADAPHSTPSSF